METFSNSLNYVQTPGSLFLTVSKRLFLVVPFFPLSRLTLYIDPTAALRLPRQMRQKTLFASKRHRVRWARHERDLISRTLSQNRSSEILLVFFFFFLFLLWRGVLRHPGTKRSSLITRLWKEERRSGENSYFWHNAATEKRPHARASSQNWACVFPASVCVSGGHHSMRVWKRNRFCK